MGGIQITCKWCRSRGFDASRDVVVQLRRDGKIHAMPRDQRKGPPGYGNAAYTHCRYRVVSVR